MSLFDRITSTTTTDSDSTDITVANPETEENATLLTYDEWADANLSPVCDGYDLSDAAADHTTKTINDDWWEKTGRHTLRATIYNSEIDQADVAEAIGLAEATVRTQLNGQTPGLAVFERYLELFGEDLFDEPAFDIEFESVTET